MFTFRGLCGLLRRIFTRPRTNAAKALYAQSLLDIHSLSSCRTADRGADVATIAIIDTAGSEPDQADTATAVQTPEAKNANNLRPRLDSSNLTTPSLLKSRNPRSFVRAPGVLLKYGRDLTSLAEEGHFDGLCNRHSEADRLERVLQRMEKRNCVLTGEAGCGKTALVELLARRIAHDEVTLALRDARIFEIRLSKMVAGTKYRGEFEQRIEEMLRAAEVADNVVLFIDEMHCLWGAGRADGAPMDAANMFKPALARGGLRVIGATTSEEYHRYIARDKALARRFQELKVMPPNSELLFHMVRSQANRLAAHHNVALSDDVVRQSIALTNRFVASRTQPDKARDILDDTCVAVATTGGRVITKPDLLGVLSEKTGLSIARLTDHQRLRLRELPEELKRHVIGQEHAVETVASTLIQRRQDLGPEHRNLGSFLFAGSTGVGKTELARAVADVFFESRSNLLHLDMAEYTLPTTVHKLLGAPAGYVGCDREGILTGWLQSHETGVILFDEIEKAGEEVWSLLLGLLDEGRIRSGSGQSFDTRQYVIVLTTNAVTPEDMEGGSLGFTGGGDNPAPTDLLAGQFPREFLGRLDEVILFNPLSHHALRSIAELRISEAVDRLARSGVRVRYAMDQLVAYVLQGQENNGGGARAVAATIERKVVQPISAAVLMCDDERPLDVELDDRFFAGKPPRGTRRAQ